MTAVVVEPPLSPDVAGDFVSAELVWRGASTSVSIDAATQVAAAQQYVLAIDAYVVQLRAHGRQVPYRIDELADSLRIIYGDGPLPPVA